jgi:hypothetical protein
VSLLRKGLKTLLRPIYFMIQTLKVLKTILFINKNVKGIQKGGAITVSKICHVLCEWTLKPDVNGMLQQATR